MVNLSSGMKKLELSFWDLAIRLMTESPRIRSLMKQAAGMVKHKEPYWVAGIFLLWLLTGLYLVLKLTILF